MIAHGTRGSATTALRAGARALHESLRRRVLTRDAAPWTISFTAHALLIVLGFFVVWTVSPPSTEDPIPVVVTFDNPSPAPIAADPDPTPIDVGGGATIAGSLSLPGPAPSVALGGAGSLLPSPAKASRPSSPIDSITDRRLPEVRFAGLGVSNAQKIVYVVDASGSMVSTLPVVWEYLERSVSRLARAQRFQVIFFGREPAMPAPHPGDIDDGAHWRLIRATPENIAQVLEWTRRVVPGGRSNPLGALRFALALEQPDAVFLLSNVITGAGQWEIDREALLREIDSLNPRDPRTGRRRTVIKTLQFYDEDPAGILRAIADAHGGAEGYKFIARTESRAP